MVIDNLYVEGITVLPAKADPPLIVDSDAMLTRPFAFEAFEAIGRGHAKIRKRSGAVQHSKFA